MTEREEFEAWYLTQSFDDEPIGSRRCAGMWSAWQAARAQPSQSQDAKDAARYRWLRDIDDDPVCSLPQLFTTTGKPSDVDAAIDAAMEKT